MSADEEALYRAILEAPEDDAPRLVYADWLEEHGRPQWAEFIRLQCEEERLGPEPPTAGQPRKVRIRNLLSAVHEQNARLQRFLREVLPGRPAAERHLTLCDYTYRRGFIDSPVVHGQTLIDAADRLFDIGPFRRLQVTAARGRCGQIARCPQLARLKELDVSNCGLGAYDIHALATCTFLSGLETLNLRGNKIGNEAARYLAESAPLANLQLLDLEDNPIGYRLIPVLRERFGERVRLPPPGYFP